jgi:DNA-binding SARP family transcriptional activator
VTLFGGFEVRLRTGTSLALPTHKYRALLAFLAVPAGRAHPREKLVALLWDDLPAHRGRSALRQAVFAIRKALDAAGPSALLAAGDTVALNPDAVSVDVTEFERAAGRDHPFALERAATLYRGDFLAGLPLAGRPFEDWLSSERERLRERAIEAFARLLAAQRRAGVPDAAIQTALRLLALDPLQEAVHRALMQLYVQQGRRLTALNQYQGCVAVLQRELGAEPEEETRALYQEILRHRSSAAAPAAREASDGSIPVATLRRQPAPLATDTPLVGRDEEMGRMRATLAGAVSGQGHLLAVVGEGGAGKTRLVAELAAEADTVGARVLIGRCHASEQILPFGPWADALGTGQVLVNRTWLETVPLAMRYELGRLFPELGPREGRPSVHPNYLKLFEGVALLLQHLADRQATVLILEDLHWADEMSVRLLAFLGRRLQPWRMLVLVTARAEHLVDASMLQRTLAELEREPHVATVPLGPPSRDDTLHLVEALSGPSRSDAAVGPLREQIWRAGEGNLFTVMRAMR